MDSRDDVMFRYNIESTAHHLRTSPLYYNLAPGPKGKVVGCAMPSLYSISVRLCDGSDARHVMTETEKTKHCNCLPACHLFSVNTFTSYLHYHLSITSLKV